MRALLAIVFVVCSAFFQAEKYYVTFVKGTVKLQRTKANIKVGDALQPADKLIFEDKDAKISCISPGKGRFDLGAAQVKPAAGGEMLAVLKSSLVPAAGSYHLSTRSLMLEGYDPKTYFSSAETNDRILLIKDEVLPIASSYKRNADNFFFLQYTAGGKTVTKKLKQNETGITFNDDAFAEGVPAKVMLCYQSVAMGKPASSVIAEFSPVPATKEELKQQVELIKQNTGTADKKSLSKEVTAHLFANYGKLGNDEIGKLIN
jgi:hypothetical protein